MRGAIQHLAIACTWLGIAGLGAVLPGCTSIVDVDADEGEDFATYQTWDWLARVPPRVDAPHADADALDARLVRAIGKKLAEDGFERADAPDFFVTFQLTLRRRAEVVNVPMAPYLLSSMDSSPSYWVEGSHKKEHIYEAVKLAIGFTRPDGRMPWRAVLVRRVEDGAVVPLEQDVAELLDRFRRGDPGDSTGD